jgi:hypothetical protein
VLANRHIFLGVLLIMLLVQNRPTIVPQHPQRRFVTGDAIALCLDRPPTAITRIDCWRHVVHVVGPGLSTFVSYADLPPVLGVVPPVAADVRLWRKRWRKHQYLAPRFWLDFYRCKLTVAADLSELSAWDELVAYISFGLTATDRQQLEAICLETTLRLAIRAA